MARSYSCPGGVVRHALAPGAVEGPELAALVEPLALCHAIGRKFGVVQANYVTRGNEIQPYRCEVRRGGERCNAPAVSNWNRRNFRCAEHRHGAHASQARLQSAGAAKGAEAPAAVASEEATAAPPIEDPTAESR